jgi:hypothetical protein
MAAGIVTTAEHILDSRNSTLYNGAPNKNPIVEAQVAQSVEHCTENAGVGGSIPPLGTTTKKFSIIPDAYKRWDSTSEKSGTHLFTILPLVQQVHGGLRQSLLVRFGCVLLSFLERVPTKDRHELMRGCAVVCCDGRTGFA